MNINPMEKTYPKAFIKKLTDEIKNEIHIKKDVNRRQSGRFWNS